MKGRTKLYYFQVLLGGGSTQGLAYLEGQGDLVSRSITPITHIVTLPIPIINLLTKSPRPSKYLRQVADFSRQESGAGCARKGA